MQHMFVVLINQGEKNLILNELLARKINLLFQYTVYIFFNLQWLMVNNLRELRERHCTSTMQLIKQDALIKTFYYSIVKQSEF